MRTKSTRRVSQRRAVVMAGVVALAATVTGCGPFVNTVTPPPPAATPGRHVHGTGVHPERLLA